MNRTISLVSIAALVCLLVVPQGAQANSGGVCVSTGCATGTVEGTVSGCVDSFFTGFSCQVKWVGTITFSGEALCGQLTGIAGSSSGCVIEGAGNGFPNP